MGIFTINANPQTPARTDVTAEGPAADNTFPQCAAPASAPATANMSPQCAVVDHAPAAANTFAQCALPTQPNPLDKFVAVHRLHPDVCTAAWQASAASEASTAAPQTTPTDTPSGSRSVFWDAVESSRGRMNLAKDSNGWDLLADAVDFVTDYTIAGKAAVKAAARGNIEDAIVLGSSPIPLPPAVKLGIWDAEKDMALATAKQAAMAAAGPLAATADRVNELRKGNVEGAFPEVAGVVHTPGELYDGAKKIAQGDVRAGVRQITPPVLSVAAVVEGWLATSRPMGPATAPASAPKELPAGAATASGAEAAAGTARSTGAGASRNTGGAAEANNTGQHSTRTNPDGDTAAMLPDRVQRRAEGQVREQQRRELAEHDAARKADDARRLAQSRARWGEIVRTMPTPFESISVDRAFAGAQNHGWPTSASMTSARHAQVWRDLGRSGEAPIVFREGQNIRIDFERLTPAQQQRLRTLGTEPVTNAHRRPFGDITVDVGAATQPAPHNTSSRGALDGTDPHAQAGQGKAKP